MYREVITVSTLKLLITGVNRLYISKISASNGRIENNIERYFDAQRIKALLDKLLKTYKRTIGNGRTKIMLSLTNEQSGIAYEFLPQIQDQEIQAIIVGITSVIHQNTVNAIHRQAQLNFFNYQH